MIVKIHNRGTGGGKGPVQYLLGRDGNRDQAELLRGDPEQTIKIIDSSKYAKKYTSLVLSFAEADLPAKAKQEIMDSCERALFPGLDPGQYQALWVQHQDKGRLELNLVVPNVELTTGKRLQPYYDRADRPRVNAWKDIINATYALHDPSDPLNAQALTLPSDLPKAAQEASEAVTRGLLAMANQGLIKSRDDVMRALTDGGFKIARETKQSISIENPEGGRNIRLKGALYGRDFSFSGGLRAEIQAASERYRACAGERLQEAKSVYSYGIEIRRDDQQRRYKRPESTNEGPRTNRMALDVNNPDPDRQRQRRGPLVDWSADYPEHYRNTGPKPANKGPQKTGRESEPEPLRREVVLPDRPTGPEVREWLSDTDRGPLDDGIRANVNRFLERIIEGARAAAERARAAAAGIAEHLQRESSAIEACGCLSKASESLNRAIDQEISNQRALSRSSDNNAGRSGGGWGPSM